jgi:hypothetical protein
LALTLARRQFQPASVRDIRSGHIVGGKHDEEIDVLQPDTETGILMFKRAAAALVAFVMLVLGLAGASAAVAQADVKVPLIRNPSNNCERGADALPGTGSLSQSLVVVHRAGQDTVRVDVVLRDAEPSATYNVFLIQVIANPDELGVAPDCQVQDGTLTTDKQGRGTLRLREKRLADASFFHVFLFSFTGGFDDFDTGRIAFP